MSESILQLNIHRPFDAFNGAHDAFQDQSYNSMKTLSKCKKYILASSDAGSQPKRTVLGEIRGRRKTFPLALHRMLEGSETNGTTDIVSWQPHGRAFRVHKPKEFERSLMPNLFNQTKWSSFQRQLNLYGFLRITSDGPDKGSYYHTSFVRGDAKLANSIQRTKIKGTMTRTRAIPEIQPNFYKYTPLDEKARGRFSQDRSTSINHIIDMRDNDKTARSSHIDTNDREILGRAMHNALSGLNAFSDDDDDETANIAHTDNSREEALLQDILRHCEKKDSMTTIHASPTPVSDDEECEESTSTKHVDQSCQGNISNIQIFNVVNDQIANEAEGQDVMDLSYLSHLSDEDYEAYMNHCLLAFSGEEDY